MQEETIVTEIMSAMKMIKSDYFRKSADGIADVFGKMFRDTVVKNFSLGQTKFPYFSLNIMLLSLIKL